jgi:low molecular weight protein-tyrosine phosphatase
MEATSPDAPRRGVLFVCLGNICRSPLAEGVFRQLVEDAGLSGVYDIDSAGTGAWHVGERPDGRMTLVAERHGITLDSRARQVEAADLERFDYVIAMDRDNLRVLERMADAEGSECEIRLLRSFDADAGESDVPDPYYGGPSGFENVYVMVRHACEALLRHIRT